MMSNAIIAIVICLVGSLNPILPKERVIEEVRALMSELHISAAELSRAIKITETGISKVFSGDRDLSYEEVQRMINYVIGRTSIIPADDEVSKYATTFDKLNWAYDDETVCQVSDRMFSKGYSQLPVKRRGSGDFLGIVSESSILKKVLHPEVKGKKIGSLEELGMLRIVEAGIIEEPPQYHIGAKMIEISQVLTNYYAVLLTSGEKVVGIVTRADVLELINMGSRALKN
jgi:predicted transcriptional regulator